MRLHPAGELLHALATGERAGRLAPDQAQQPGHPLVAEVLEVRRVGVQRGLDGVEVHRRPDADPGIEPAAGQYVDRAEILGQPERVLPAERDHRRSQLDPAGPLRRRRQDGDRRGNAVLQVPVTYPRAVEAEALAQFDDLQRRLVPGPRVVTVEQPDSEKTEPVQHDSGWRHAASLRARRPRNRGASGCHDLSRCPPARTEGCPAERLARTVVPSRMRDVDHGRQLLVSREPLSPIAAWFRSSRRMLAAELSQGGWLNFGTFRWSDIDVPRALRAGVGMATPLALGLATNHLEYGVFAALGALPAGMVSFQGASRTRVTAVVFASVGMAVATLVGGVCAYLGGWLLFPAVLLFSYLGGLMVTLGQRFLVVGLQWAIQLVIASAIPLGPGDAGLRALLVLAGGLWQGLLVVASWTVTSGNQERNSLAVAYRLLAGYAADSCRLPASSGPVPPPAVFDSQAVTDPNPLLRAQYRYRFLLLLQEADRIRVSLAAVAAYRPQCTVLEPVAGVLAGIADALEARRGHDVLAGALQERLAAIELPADAPWRWAAAALLGELRGSVRTLRRLDVRDTEPTAEPVSLPGH